MDSQKLLGHVAEAIRHGGYEDPGFQLGLVLHAIGLTPRPYVGQPHALTRALLADGAGALQVLDATAERLLRDLAPHLARGGAVEQFLGYSFVRGLKVFTPPTVLAPGPEAQTLVDIAVAVVPAHRPSIVVDVCTGSGVVAILIGHERPRAQVIGIDIDPKTLRQALGTQALHGIANTRWIAGDLFEGLGESLWSRCTVVTANPPYCTTDELHARPRWLTYAPDPAIDGGTDGLVLVRRLAARARQYLVAGGVLVLQHGSGQDDEVAQLCASSGYGAIARHRNVFGEFRFVTATWNGC